MANIHADIKPSGYKQGHLVDCLYDYISSIKGICAKLDADGGVADTDYEDNVYTAIFNGSITDSAGNMLVNQVSEERFFILTPYAVSDKALLECLYQLLDMIETLTEQLDADGTVNSTTYEATAYTAVILKTVENCKGSQLGNGTNFLFRPGGVTPARELVDLLYQVGYAIWKVTDMLDDDTGVTGTDYEALWYTANMQVLVENGAGSRIGNQRGY